MTEKPMPAGRCRNEGCVRAAEPGGSWCSQCDLERSLYRREDRPSPREARSHRESGG